MGRTVAIPCDGGGTARCVGGRHKFVTLRQDFSQTSTSIRQAWSGYIEDVNGMKFIPVARFFEPHN